MEEYVVVFEDDREIEGFSSYENAEEFVKEVLHDCASGMHETFNAGIYKKEAELRATVETEVKIEYV